MRLRFVRRRDECFTHYLNSVVHVKNYDFEQTLLESIRRVTTFAAGNVVIRQEKKIERSKPGFFALNKILSISLLNTFVIITLISEKHCSRPRSYEPSSV